MSSQSIDAYQTPERLDSYDADMDVMHPNRVRMADVVLEFLPSQPDEALKALDLGSGTGYFADRFLSRFPKAELVGLDGSQPMLELAVARLGRKAARAITVKGDFRNLSALVEGQAPFDAAFSAYALHHLDAGDKIRVVQQVLANLKPGGWFFNADLIVADSVAVEERIQKLRVEGIVSRAKPQDHRFGDLARTRVHLDQLEAEDGDQPLTLQEDLAVLRAAGAVEVSVIWLEHREAVTCCRAS